MYSTFAAHLHSCLLTMHGLNAHLVTIPRRKTWTPHRGIHTAGRNLVLLILQPQNGVFARWGRGGVMNVCAHRALVRLRYSGKTKKNSLLGAQSEREKSRKAEKWFMNWGNLSNSWTFNIGHVFWSSGCPTNAPGSVFLKLQTIMHQVRL